MTAGIKTGEKDKPKPMVEKVADAKPVDDAVGKITEKKPIVTASAAEPPPKPVEKPVEKKPDPPNRSPRSSRRKSRSSREEARSAEGGSDRRSVEIGRGQEAETEAGSQGRAAAAAEAEEERTFDQSKIAALLDKRDPTRQSITGATLNSSASLGTTPGTAATLSQSELDAMRARLASLWNVQPDVEHPEELDVTIRIRLNPDRRLAGPPQVVSTGSSPRYQAAADAAVRAVLQGQPYTMLRDETYEQWKYMDIDFDPKQMFHS